MSAATKVPTGSPVQTTKDPFVTAIDCGMLAREIEAVLCAATEMYGEDGGHELLCAAYRISRSLVLAADQLELICNKPEANHDLQ